ncbi:sirohydrochlorin chelatase [Oceanobacillus piezotolerans]|uniref:Sirohydrochlorin chelatase n=1 Tax=Oceanobacillus piezotolerans TaxID=2448030 RepID=A0A498D8Y7_9BACI|nr:sirohydrochlorin chelatase [Oceanobacillus piezotolerans]RLL47743.1 sirohydrochlorin chelatase [Oceanobacillus piezotolerans]
MQGVLYVSHGSRRPEATAEAIAFLSLVREQVNIDLQEICFLELANPNIEQGIDSLVKQGVSRISIVPVLLLSAGHYFHDIPEEVDRVRKKYPKIKFTYGKPLGVQKRLTHILKDRIEETGVPLNPDAKILLIGRGSNNPRTKQDIEEIAEQLKEKVDREVETCYLAACSPSFEEGLHNVLKGEHSQVFIVPYLWFTGVLMETIEKRVNEYHSFGKEIIVCHQLGNHPSIVAALKDRVYETI